MNIYKWAQGIITVLLLVGIFFFLFSNFQNPADSNVSKVNLLNKDKILDELLLKKNYDAKKKLEKKSPMKLPIGEDQEKMQRLGNQYHSRQKTYWLRTGPIPNESIVYRGEVSSHKMPFIAFNDEWGVEECTEITYCHIKYAIESDLSVRSLMYYLDSKKFTKKIMAENGKIFLPDITEGVYLVRMKLVNKPVQYAQVFKWVDKFQVQVKNCYKLKIEFSNCPSGVQPVIYSLLVGNWYSNISIPISDLMVLPNGEIILPEDDYFLQIGVFEDAFRNYNIKLYKDTVYQIDMSEFDTFKFNLGEFKDKFCTAFDIDPISLDQKGQIAFTLPKIFMEDIGHPLYLHDFCASLQVKTKEVVIKEFAKIYHIDYFIKDQYGSDLSHLIKFKIVEDHSDAKKAEDSEEIRHTNFDGNSWEMEKAYYGNNFGNRDKENRQTRFWFSKSNFNKGFLQVKWYVKPGLIIEKKYPINENTTEIHESIELDPSLYFDLELGGEFVLGDNRNISVFYTNSYDSNYFWKKIKKSIEKILFSPVLIIESERSYAQDNKVELGYSEDEKVSDGEESIQEFFKEKIKLNIYVNGYVDTEEFVINRGQVNTVKLKKINSYYGKVVNQDNKPIKDYELTIAIDDHYEVESFKVETDGEGLFSFESKNNFDLHLQSSTLKVYNTLDFLESNEASPLLFKVFIAKNRKLRIVSENGVPLEGAMIIAFSFQNSFPSNEESNNQYYVYYTNNAGEIVFDDFTINHFSVYYPGYEPIIDSYLPFEEEIVSEIKLLKEKPIETIINLFVDDKIKNEFIFSKQLIKLILQRFKLEQAGIFNPLFKNGGNIHSSGLSIQCPMHSGIYKINYFDFKKDELAYIRSIDVYMPFVGKKINFVKPDDISNISEFKVAFGNDNYYYYSNELKLINKQSCFDLENLLERDFYEVNDIKGQIKLDIKREDGLEVNLKFDLLNIPDVIEVEFLKAKEKLIQIKNTRGEFLDGVSFFESFSEGSKPAEAQLRVVTSEKEGNRIFKLQRDEPELNGKIIVKCTQYENLSFDFDQLKEGRNVFVLENYKGRVLLHHEKIKNERLSFVPCGSLDRESSLSVQLENKQDFTELLLKPGIWKIISDYSTEQFFVVKEKDLTEITLNSIGTSSYSYNFSLNENKDFLIPHSWSNPIEQKTASYLETSYSVKLTSLFDTKIKIGERTSEYVIPIGNFKRNTAIIDLSKPSVNIDGCITYYRNHPLQPMYFRAEAKRFYSDQLLSKEIPFYSLICLEENSCSIKKYLGFQDSKPLAEDFKTEDFAYFFNGSIYDVSFMWSENGDVLDLPYKFSSEMKLKLIGFKAKGFGFWSKDKVTLVREFTRGQIKIDDLPSATIGKAAIKAKIPVGALYLFSIELGCIVPFQKNIKNGFILRDKYYSDNAVFYIYNLGHEIELEFKMVPVGNYQLVVYDDENQKIFKSEIFNIKTNTELIEINIK